MQFFAYYCEACGFYVASPALNPKCPNGKSNLTRAEKGSEKYEEINNAGKKLLKMICEGQ